MARIALDASGGDFAPERPVAGALEALSTLPKSCEIVLVGREAEVSAELERQGGSRDRISIADAPETIGMGEKPLAALKSKRQSSIRVGLELQKEGRAHAFISAGNTGAMMAASLVVLGKHEGVERPAIGTVLPTIGKPVLLLDAGANVDCSPRELLGFAQLGAVYARDIFGQPEPTVGLLNIGEEPEKGNTASKEAFPLLQGNTHFHFRGNVEGSDILQGVCDVIVCDGFVGNIALKFYESVGRTVINLMQQELDETVVQSHGARRVFEFLDYSTYGGAPLLGVQGVSIICHGRSSPRAFANAIRLAFRAVDAHLSDHIHDEFVPDGVVA
jgi:phosphate acyltransferase